MHLIVTEPFDGHEKGERITEGVEAILAGEHARHVTKVAEPDSGVEDEVEKPADKKAKGKSADPAPSGSDPT